jgi:predicted LPLAT superfamily acyltransferase
MDDTGHDKWSGKSRGGGFGHRFFIFLIQRGGIRLAYFFLALVVIYFIPFAPRATASVWFYNRRILRRSRLKSLCRLPLHYYRFGQTLIDKIAIGAGMSNKFKFEFDNYTDFLKILDSGSGVVMIGAHVGCWEAGSQFFGDYARRMNIVLYDAEYAKIKEALESSSTGREFKVIAVGEDGLDSILRIKNALDKSEYVCFQGDRYVGDAATVEAEFMGHVAHFPRGPFLLGSRMKVPVIFYYAMRTHGRCYKFSFTESGQQTEKGILTEYLRSTEQIVNSHPEQWFNFYKFWR